MDTWFVYLKRGLSRKLPEDRIAGREGYAGIKANLQNLRPFVARHWRKGVLGALLIVFTSLLSFPQSLITRYLIDDVILGRQLGLLAGAILLLAGIKVLGMLTGLLQQFYFARFEQEVILDVQHDLLDRTLHLPKSFFDDKETGHLMSRLSSDVGGLRWFFSSTIVYIISNILRFVGGAVLLFYLEGCNSPVGERGVNLSEGQKQRLAIARALIKDPDIQAWRGECSDRDALEPVQPPLLSVRRPDGLVLANGAARP